MGAKTWMLVYATGRASEALCKCAGSLDRTATTHLAARLFPDERPEPLPDDGDLLYTNPPDDELFIGCYPSVSIVAAVDFAIDRPSTLPSRFLAAGPDQTVYLHAMHSVVDWLAFAVWEKGRLLRALSLAPDSGIMEDIGQRFDFEQPYWTGSHPVDDPEDEVDEEERYPFPFHPLELGEEALKAFFGYQLEGLINPTLLQPETVPLLHFRRVT